MIKHLTLGKNRNKPRIWLEGNSLVTNEFEPGMSFNVHYNEGHILIEASMIGTNTTSTHRNKPCIDINSTKVTESLGEDTTRIKVELNAGLIAIYPLPAESELKRAIKKASDPTFTFIDMFAGIGTSSHAAEKAGLHAIGAVEIGEHECEQYAINFPNAKVINGSVTEADWKTFTDCNVLLASPPCPAYSNAGKARRGKEGKHEEAHDSGWLGYAILEAVRICRPSHVVVENVENYASSSIMTIIRQALASFGYTYQSETILDGEALGDMTKRRRFAGVYSVVDGFEFNLQPMRQRPVYSILEGSLAEREWLDDATATVKTFLRREAEHKVKGNGFKSGAVKPSETIVPAITAGYAKRRLTDGMLAHPEKEHCISFFSPRECARIHGIDDSFALDPIKTKAYQGIGNGISASQWAHAVFKPLVHHLHKMST